MRMRATRPNQVPTAHRPLTRGCNPATPLTSPATPLTSPATPIAETPRPCGQRRSLSRLRLRLPLKGLMVTLMDTTVPLRSSPRLGLLRLRRRLGLRRLRRTRLQRRLGWRWRRWFLLWWRRSSRISPNQASRAGDLISGARMGSHRINDHRTPQTHRCRYPFIHWLTETPWPGGGDTPASSQTTFPATISHHAHWVFRRQL
jgi:hypothetical protein